MGTKWGVSPRWLPAAEEKHVFPCIHMETPLLLLPLSLPLSTLFFFKSNKGKRPRLLFARTLNQCRSRPHGRPPVRPSVRPTAAVSASDSASDLIKRRRGKAITLFTFCPLLKVAFCKPLRPRPGGGPAFCNEFLQIKNE